MVAGASSPPPADAPCPGARGRALPLPQRPPIGVEHAPAEPVQDPALALGPGVPARSELASSSVRVCGRRGELRASGVRRLLATWPLDEAPTRRLPRRWPSRAAAAGRRGAPSLAGLPPHRRGPGGQAPFKWPRCANPLKRRQGRPAHRQASRFQLCEACGEFLRSKRFLELRDHVVHPLRVFRTRAVSTPARLTTRGLRQARASSPSSSAPPFVASRASRRSSAHPAGYLIRSRPACHTAAAEPSSSPTRAASGGRTRVDPGAPHA